MTEQQIIDKIDRKSRERKKVWAAGMDPARSAELASEIEELYAALRLLRARSSSGDRRDIVKRARIERELEKLGG